MGYRCYLVCSLIFCFATLGCGKKDSPETMVVAPDPVETPKTIEQEYIFTKKSDYVEKCEDDLDALEIKLGKIRDHLANESKIDPLEIETTIKDLYSRLDYADEVLDRLRMSAVDGWKGDQQIVLKAIESLDDACKEAMEDLGMPSS